MNRGHQAALNANLPVQCFNNRCQAVGGAGGIGNDVVFGGQHMVIHSIDNHRVGVRRGSGNNDLACAGLEVALGLVAGGKQTCALEDHIHVVVFPGQFFRVADRGDGDAVTVDGE